MSAAAVILTGLSSAPVQAVDYISFAVDGAIGVTETTYTDQPTQNPPWPCNGIYCPVQRSYVRNISYAFDLPFHPDGHYEFYKDYAPEQRTTISVSFTYLGNGAYSPANLSLYSYYFGPFDPMNYFEISGSGSVRVRQVAPPPVPEPGTWALMLTGFASLAFAMRRARRMALSLALAVR